MFLLAPNKSTDSKFQAHLKQWTSSHCLCPNAKIQMSKIQFNQINERLIEIYEDTYIPDEWSLILTGTSSREPRL